MPYICSPVMKSYSKSQNLRHAHVCMIFLFYDVLFPSAPDNDIDRDLTNLRAIFPFRNEMNDRWILEEKADMTSTCSRARHEHIMPIIYWYDVQFQARNAKVRAHTYDNLSENAWPVRPWRCPLLTVQFRSFVFARSRHAMQSLACTHMSRLRPLSLFLTFISFQFARKLNYYQLSILTSHMFLSSATIRNLPHLHSVR